MKPEVKAELIAIGAVDIDRSLLGRLTIPTAGPGAGGTAFFFRSGGRRVRLVVDSGSPLRAVKEGDEIVILKGGVELVRGEIEEELIHCPGQAFITISERCVYDCKFCPVPKLQGRVKSLEEIMGMVEEAYQRGGMKAISLTSGIADSTEKEVERAVEITRALHQRYPDIPIGVSVYPTRDSSQRLKEAGATEIKYNVETMDRPLYRRVCPGQDLDFILESLQGAVKIFGRGRVYSNILIGLGESDQTILEGVKELAGMGVIPILRAAGMHPLRLGEIEVERPTRHRLLRLARAARQILDTHGLDASKAQTMCLPCTGCDLNPNTDL